MHVSVFLSRSIKWCFNYKGGWLIIKILNLVIIYKLLKLNLFIKTKETVNLFYMYFCPLFYKINSFVWWNLLASFDFLSVNVINNLHKQSNRINVLNLWMS